MSIVSSAFFLIFSTLFFRRGIVDYFLFSFFSASLFFLPVFVGEVGGPPGYPRLPISAHIYFTYWLLCFLLFLSANVFDAHVGPRAFPLSVKEFLQSARGRLGYGIVFLMAFALIFDFDLLSFSTKREMMDEAGIRVQLAMPCLIISAIFFSLSGRLRYKIGGMLLALTSIYIGFRSYFACYAVVMAIIIYNARFETIKLKSSWKFLFYIIPVFIFVVLSKRIYAGLKMDVGVTNIFEGGLIEAFVKGSEFFSTQYIYQSIINNEYSLEIKNYILSFLALLPIPQSLWGGGSSYFNKAFQADLFSDVSYGMAYNPWAEAYAYGNIFGVIIFVVFYCYFLFCMQWLHIKFRYTVLPVLMSILLFYHGFYFHRNSLAVEFSFIRNYSYLFLLGCFFMGGVLYLKRERTR